ncbi:MAG: AAA-like domain-containing protein [Anaerolineae bacterium]|nr:AAA-like domain-containing protein [Anaerolineae bacterium]
MSINPFTYGKPIDAPARFIGHRREAEQVYSRLLSAFESTSIVGERRTGKTSLLKYLAHPETQAQFGLESEKYIFIYQDFQLLEDSTMPARFWQRVLRAVQRAIKGHEGIVAEIDLATKSETIDNYTLDDIFTLIDEADLYIVLLLDEFETVTRNEHFDNDFFGGLRALAIHHNLALVTSSRQSLVELTHSEEVRSSPFFNIFATIHLRAFSEEEATDLIEQYLAETGVKFLISELNVIFAVAGYHPHFLQMAGHHLFAAHEKEMDSPARCHYVVEQVHGEAGPLFWDYWHDSSSAEKILLTVMALRELERDGGEDTIAELETFYTRAEQVMPDLERRALVIKNPLNSAYHLFSTELRNWITDEIFGDAKDLRAWRDWQKADSLILSLSTSMQDILAKTVSVLNPAYQDILGSWLLEPSSSGAAMKLVQSCANSYEPSGEQAQLDFISKVADEQKPVGDTPKGLFDRLTQQLNQTQPPVAPPPAATSTAMLPPEEAIISTGRRLSLRGGNKAVANPVALGGLIISGIVTGLNLEPGDQGFVNGELAWLFGATDNLLKICRNEIEPGQPITVPIPPDAERVTTANNQLLPTIDDSILTSWKSWLEKRLEWIGAWLKDLDLLLEQEASRGTAAKSDLELQNKIRSKRIEIGQVLEEMAELMKQAYGIRVTTPGQLVELLEG